MIEDKVHICGVAKDCGKHLKKVFQNIEKIGSLFKNYDITVCFDKSLDQTENELLNLQDYFKNININFNLIQKKEEQTNIRTENISNARNAVLDQIYSNTDYKYKYFIMIDLDNINAGEMYLDSLKQVLSYTCEWDAVSFNRKPYYDIWALSFDDFSVSCFNFDFIEPFRNFIQNMHTQAKAENRKCEVLGIKELMQIKITERLSNLNSADLYPVLSAFNGFCIYKKNKFKDCRYSWKVSDNYKFFSW